MQRKEMTFRITKIGKTAVSVAVCGLMMAAASTSVFATEYNLRVNPTVAIAGSTNSAAIHYNDGVAGTSYLMGQTFGIDLSVGVNLTGQSGIGGTPLAVFTYPTNYFGNSIDDVFFSTNTSSLTLRGDNKITGEVGVHWFGEDDVRADRLGAINIYNQGNVFHDEVYANQINLYGGTTVQFLGDIDGDYVGQIVDGKSSLNYQGSNSTVTLGTGVTLDGNVTNTSISNSSLIFNGTGTIAGSVGSSTTGIGTVQVNGNGALVRVNDNLSTDRLDYQAASTVAVGGNLYLNVNTAADATNAVTLGNTGGVLQVGGNMVGGNIVGVAGKAAVTTTLTNTGTVTMVSGTQAITGNVGSSGLSIGTLNIGGTGTDTTSSTSVSGNIYASTVSLNNGDSTLTMNSGYNLTGDVITESNGTGNLVLAGGTQKVDGQVGDTFDPTGPAGYRLNTVTSGAKDAASTFTGTVYATTVTNGTGTGSSTFQADVTASNVGVNNGTSNFQQSLTAMTTTIGTGTGNFNTVGGTTSSNIVFSGAGTANLNKGLLTGNIYFSGQEGTVNLVNGESISGFIKGGNTLTSTTVAGTLNALGGGTLSSDVGKLTALNVNKDTAAAITDTNDVTAKTLYANGSIDAASVKLFNDGTLQMADNANLTGEVTTTKNNTGTLTLQGTSTVTGNVGISDTALTALKTINAGATNGPDNEVVTFNSGVVYAEKLNFTGNGTVIFNGLNATDAVFSNGVVTTAGTDKGFIGTVDFGSGGVGTLELGNGVDLNTADTKFENANAATLRFNGNSVVTGQLGGGVVGVNEVTGKNFVSSIDSTTFQSIYAGKNGETVTFMDKVFVSGTTFHVSGTGTVNFLDDLNGSLQFGDSGVDPVLKGDGIVNVASGVNINGPVSTAVNATGTLNFVGSATTQADIGQADIGTVSNRLKEITFHAKVANVVDGYLDEIFVVPATANVNIRDNLYAVTTTIGNGTNPTVATITATGKHLGTNLVLSDTTTLNTAGTVTGSNAISPVDFVHTKNANGTLTNTATVTQSTTGTGAITTNGANLNFALATTAWDANAGGTANAAGSSSITGGEGSTLAMNGNETVNLSLLGSLRNGQQYTLIDVASDNDNTALPSTVKDNSYVITTTLTRSNNNTDANADLDGDLIVTATRANNVYITASNTTGHFSNPAALRLGTLAAAGATYSADMQTVLNKLDIDQWGFGNNAANLAVQAQRLAPLANNSIGLSAFTAASAVSDSLGMRMHQIRIPEQAQAYEAKGVWLRSLYNQGKQETVGQYDGFKSKVTGMTFGVDAYPSRDSLVGLALSYSTTDVEQQNFRQGDEASMDAWHLSMYAAYNFTPEWFVDGTLTGSKVNTTGNRSTAVGRVASFDVDGTQWTGKVNLGYRFKLGDSAMFLTPILSLQSSSLKQDAYNETGAGDIGLEVAGSTLRQNQAALGLRLDGTTLMGGMVVKPEVTLAATRDSGAYGKDISAQFIGDLTNTAFTTESAEASGLNGVKLSVGLGVLLNKTTSMALRYEHAQKRHSGVSGKAFSSDAVEFNVRWNF